MRKTVGILAAFLGSLAVWAGDVAAASGYRLEAVVLINRHGIRTPLNFEIAKDVYILDVAKQDWPDFGVKEGNLTRHGARAAQVMGAYYGDYFRDGGLLPQSGCLSRDKVWIHADHDQRTIRTAKMMTRGMAPGCTYEVTHVGKKVPDPLIDPTAAGICTYDEPSNEAAEHALKGISDDVSVNAYAHSLDYLQEVLECCSPAVCSALDAKTDNCTLADAPAGALTSVATNVSENFVMEYADKLPMSQVGWGRIGSATDVSFLNQMHALEFWSGNSNPYGAAVQGSNLVHHALEALSKAGSGHGPLLSMIVAHDNNLLNVAGLLGISWFLDSYQHNQVPPGAGIALELWRAPATGKLFVAVVVRGQTLDQLRSKTALSPDGTEPAMSDLTVLACPTATTDGYCPFEPFHDAITKALDHSCVGKSTPSR